MRVSLARRSQGWHAQWNDGTNNRQISGTMHMLQRLEDRCRVNGEGGWDGRA